MPEKRRHPRVQTSQPVLYYREMSPRPRVGSVIDLGPAGAAIETPYSLEEGEAIDISIALGQRVFSCKAKVLYALWSEGKRLRAGLEFERISIEDRLLLGQYLSQAGGKRYES